MTDSNLRLVCEVAAAWAGEYGFTEPDRARAVILAVYSVDPDALEPRDRHWAIDAAVALVLSVPSMTLDDDTARDLSHAAANVRTWTTKRNDLILEALAAGAGVREVARATGLAPASVLNIQTPKKRGGT